MCGISGFFHPQRDFTDDNEWRVKIDSMKKSLRHRGPDEEDTFTSVHSCLAHTRLSIRDISHGHQPMTATFLGRKCTIVYNGEIYNCDELRSYLGQWNLEWKTRSDTEVILNGYLAMGTEFFRMLNGIFAFAIYDNDERIVLVRDQLGVKPLFYQMTDGFLVFGSEPKALFAFGIRPEADEESFGEIFALGPARTPGKGGFKGMKEVLPGHFIVSDIYHGPVEINDSVYWSLKGAAHFQSYDETVDYVSWLLTDSIRRQMVSDIPICSFLSGGLDSSIVTAICHNELVKEGKRLNTFSFDFTDNDKNFKENSFQSSQDRPYVDKMVSFLGTNHSYLECGNEIQAEYLFKAVDSRDYPCMADIESSLMYFCEIVSQTEKVALTGECADEIFGGYPWFHRKEMWDRDLFPWSYDIDARIVLLKDDFMSKEYFMNYAKSAYQKTIDDTPIFEEDNATEKRRREISWLNVTWFMETLLNRMDRTSMSCGLEARVPYADYRILEYVYNVPWDYKCRNGRTKSLLIDMSRNLLPEEVYNRKKSPYPKTYDPAYEKLLTNKFLEMLYSGSALSVIVDKHKAEQFLLKEKDYGRPWYGQLMAGPQMIAYMLQVGYWLDKYKLI